MKREILFRGKRIDSGEWVHGNYTAMEEDNHNEPFNYKPQKIYHRIWQWESGDWSLGGYARYEVIAETVGQFTGLTNKNGVKIFEGDIVKTYRGSFYRVEDMIEFHLWIERQFARSPELSISDTIHDNQ
jgi:uncharacterized phage protein (TIGR01671 family)